MIFMKKTLILLLAVTLFSGCKNEEEQTSEIPETAAPIDHEQAVQPGDVGDMDDIQLDQGEPWEVKPEISESMEQISGLISDRSFQTATEYRELGAELEEERKELENILETDADYNSNLRIYLSSLDEKIKQLKQVSSTQEGDRLITELEQQLQLYPNYFL